MGAHTQVRIRQSAAVHMKGPMKRQARDTTDRPLVGALLHQTEELLSRAVVAVLLVQLLDRGQQLVDNGLQLRAADRL